LLYIKNSILFHSRISDNDYLDQQSTFRIKYSDII
jgi:hypothetical protein